MRKIIQIAHSMAFQNIPAGSWYRSAEYDHERLYALCDDGTLWSYYRAYKDKKSDADGWQKIRPIPQDDTEAA